MLNVVHFMVECHTPRAKNSVLFSVFFFHPICCSTLQITVIIYVKTCTSTVFFG